MIYHDKHGLKQQKKFKCCELDDIGTKGTSVVYKYRNHHSSFGIFIFQVLLGMQLFKQELKSFPTSMVIGNN